MLLLVILACWFLLYWYVDFCYIGMVLLVISVWCYLLYWYVVICYTRMSLFFAWVCCYLSYWYVVIRHIVVIFFLISACDYLLLFVFLSLLCHVPGDRQQPSMHISRMYMQVCVHARTQVQTVSWEKQHACMMECTYACIYTSVYPSMCIHVCILIAYIDAYTHLTCALIYTQYCDTYT